MHLDPVVVKDDRTLVEKSREVVGDRSDAALVLKDRVIRLPVQLHAADGAVAALILQFAWMNGTARVPRIAGEWDVGAQVLIQVDDVHVRRSPSEPAQHQRSMVPAHHGHQFIAEDAQPGHGMVVSLHAAPVVQCRSSGYVAPAGSGHLEAVRKGLPFLQLKGHRAVRRGQGDRDVGRGHGQHVGHHGHVHPQHVGAFAFALPQRVSLGILWYLSNKLNRGERHAAGFQPVYPCCHLAFTGAAMGVEQLAKAKYKDQQQGAEHGRISK
ncbi:MAG TPA: hypothetical protein PLL18_06395 [Flavobacteriales bacterium]|nr:hypothetical protein [Flavobacteriales bacterium]